MPYVPRGNKQGQLPDQPQAFEGPFMPLGADPFQPVAMITSPVAPDDDASFADLVSTNFRYESILGTIAETGAYRLARLAQDRDKNYDPMQDPSVIELPPHLKSLFEDSMSAGETEIIHERIKLEREWAQTLATEGMSARGFVASMISQAPDMLMLHALGVATNLANAPTLAGRVTRGAAIAAGTEAAQEAFKHGMQETRTAEQSAGNILGATVLGAAIPFAGTMARQLGKGLDAAGRKLDPVAARAYNGLDDSIDGLKDELANPLNYAEASAGGLAERVPLIKDWSPNFRVSKWKSESMQKAQRALLQTTRILNKNIAGEASESVEAATKFHYGLLNNAVIEETKQFEKYAGGYATQVGNLISRTKLTRKEFANAVSQAVRTGEHEIPEVMAAAKPYQDLFKHFAGEMRSSGLADIADNERYLQRLYDYVKIRSDAAGWDDYITKALVDLKGMDPVEARNIAASVRETLTDAKGVMHGIGGQTGPLKSRVFDLPDEVLAPWMVNDIREIASHYTRYVAPRIELAKAANRSGVTARMGNIIERIKTAELDAESTGSLLDGGLYPETMIDNTGRIVDDPLAKEINGLIRSAKENADTRLEKLQLAKAVEKHKIARDAVNINWLKDEVRADYKAKYDKLVAEGRTDLANKLNKEKTTALTELEASRQLILGAYGQDNDPTGIVSRVTRGALAWNQLRLLGRVVLSQIPDMVVPSMKFGAKRSAKAAYALATTLRNDAELAGDLQTIRAFAGAIDSINNNRILEVSDMGGRSFERTAVEEGLERLQGVGGKLTGFNAFNDFNKQVAALSFSDYALRAARTVADGGKLSKHDKPFLASLGLGDKELKMLANLSASEHNGLLVPDFGRWGGVDSPSSRVYATALRKAVDETIVTPTLGQKALVTRTNWGKLMFQFKGYMQASTESIFGFLEQKWTLGDRNDRIGVVVATSSMIGAGAVSYTLKRLAYGKGLPSDVDEFAIEALDNSGIGGLFMEVNNTVEKISGGEIGLRPALGVQAGSFRYSSRSPLGSMLGPAFTGAEDIYNIGQNWGKIVGPEPMPSSLKKNMIKMAPLNNALFLNMAYDGIDFIGESVTGGGFLPGKPLRRIGDEPSAVP